MARLFDDASSQYLRNANAVLTTFPVSMAAWFYSDDLADDGWLVSLCDRSEVTTNAIIGIRFSGNVAGDYVRAQQNGGTGANSTTSVSLNTWHHCTGIFTSNTSRTVYLDGGGAGTNSTSHTWGTPADTYVGCSAYNSGEINYFSGRIAHAAIWNTSLTATDAAILAAGYPPTLVKPENLASYWPLVARTSPEIDIVGGYDLTLYNTPTIADHPPMFWQAGLVLPPLEAIGILGGLYRRRLIFAG